MLIGGRVICRSSGLLSKRHVATVLLLGAAGLASVGCDDIFGGSDLDLTLAVSDTLVGPDRPVTVTITATSTGDAVAWGQGSSSCQLTAVVRVDGSDHSIDLRGCTDDLVLQGVVAGGTRVEQWSWSGQYLTDTGFEPLPAGRHELFALAGDLERSDGVGVRVQQE
jgi:hypothetical protein